MSTSLVTFPTPSQLPAPVAEAYEAAMAEVLNLVRSPQVQQRFAAVLLSELRTQRALQQCTPQSIVLAVVEMVQHGLDQVVHLPGAVLRKGIMQLVLEVTRTGAYSHRMSPFKIPRNILKIQRLEACLKKIT